MKALELYVRRSERNPPGIYCFPSLSTSVLAGQQHSAGFLCLMINEVAKLRSAGNLAVPDPLFFAISWPLRIFFQCFAIKGFCYEDY